MFIRFLYLLLAAGASVLAGDQFSFQTHYIPVDAHENTVAIVADASGNFFIVTVESQDTSSLAIRATKTDPQGNLLGSLGFGAGVVPSSAAVDPAGNLFVVGTRQGDRSPSTGLTLTEAAVFKLANDLSQVLATATLGNRTASITGAGGVTVDSAGRIYVVGGTGAADFPVTPGAYQTVLPPPPLSFCAPPSDGFITVFTNDLSGIVYSTYVGNSIDSLAGTGIRQVAVDPAGIVTVAGEVAGSNISGTHCNVHYNNFGSFGFISKFRPDLGALLGTVNVGISVGDEIDSMWMDSHGDVLISGYAADGLPFGPGALQQHAHKMYETGAYYTYTAGFLAEFDSNLELVWGTYFGAPGGVYSSTFDSQGNIWVTGSAQLFTLPGVSSASTSYTPFVAELSPDGSSVLVLATSQFGGTAVIPTPSGSVAFLGFPDSFLTLGPPDQPSFLTVTSSADNVSSGTIAPLELISLYGTGIGPDMPVSGQVVNGVFTNSLSGYQVLFNGTPAPILYADSNQFNVVSPRAIAGLQSAGIEIAGPQGSTAFPTVFVAASHPRIFPIALNQDGTLNSKSNPAPSGSTLTIFATGVGLTSDQLPDGSAVALADSGDPVLPISWYLGTQVPYAAGAPGGVLGLTEIQFQRSYPINPLGEGISIQVGDSISNPITIY